MILVLDNYDSFTYNLVDYFEQLGVQSQVYHNDEPVSQIYSGTYSGVVLSPGPQVPQTSGNLLQVLEHYASTHPILGICLGHQAIGQFFGAELSKAIRPMHGKISTLQPLAPHALFDGITFPFQVVRYHSLVVQKLTSPLIATAASDEGEIMALKHEKLPIWGMQFHPEAILTEHGLNLLGNWIVYNKIT